MDTRPSLARHQSLASPPVVTSLTFNQSLISLILVFYQPPLVLTSFPLIYLIFLYYCLSLASTSSPLVLSLVQSSTSPFASLPLVPLVPSLVHHQSLTWWGPAIVHLASCIIRVHCDGAHSASTGGLRSTVGSRSAVGGQQVGSRWEAGGQQVGNMWGVGGVYVGYR